MKSIANRILASNINLQLLLQNSLAVTQAYAASANASAAAIPKLYKQMVLAQIELFEQDNKNGKELPKK